MSGQPAWEGEGASQLLQHLDLRVGTDLQPIEEVEQAVRRHGERYLARLFTSHEVRTCGGADAPPAVLAPGLAARFAAKEATLKLLRPTREVVPLWTEIEVVSTPGGWTELALFGQSATMARAAGIAFLRLTMSHGGGFALATVVGVIHVTTDAASKSARGKHGGALP